MALAEKSGVARSTVQNFFAGRAVSHAKFLSICEILTLEWREVVDRAETIETMGQMLQSRSTDIGNWVQQIRKQIEPSIQERCGTMRVLDMSQPINLDEIYINVNILEKITGRRRLEIAELLQDCSSERFDRLGLSRVIEKKVSGLNAVQRYRKLMVLGKPGAGKTTFLKHLAMQCIEGGFQQDCVPIFVTLKDLAEAPEQPDLLNYIVQQVSMCGVGDAAPKVEQLLTQGKGLLLLDGLDEVRATESKQLLKHIQAFSDRFYLNPFVMTCRIAAQEYTFAQFTEVEVADFDNEQIAKFAANWFQIEADPVRAERFVDKLKDKKNEPIYELATNPLLLTLLCLVFEETGNFPANRSELYQEGLDVLLKKWDAKRNIERDWVYQQLSFQRKKDLLGKIAFNTFKQGEYFFKKKALQWQIADYICNLPHVSTKPEQLQWDTEVILKSIEAQHGLLVERARDIYSFSHLTFQEYFAALEITATHSLELLVDRITEKRWREVFLLVTGMMRNADRLLQLMKKKIDGLVAEDEILQRFLTSVCQRACMVNAPFKPAIIRAYFIVLNRGFASDNDLLRDLAIALNCNFDIDGIDSGIDFILASILRNVREIEENKKQYQDQHVEFTLTPVITIANRLKRLLGLEIEPAFREKLQQLKAQLPVTEHLPESGSYRLEFKKWVETSSLLWTQQFRKATIEYRDIGHDWQFGVDQQQLMRHYYEAIELLLNCLNSDCYVSREVRQEIEDTLLLPADKIGESMAVNSESR